MKLYNDNITANILKKILEKDFKPGKDTYYSKKLRNYFNKYAQYAGYKNALDFLDFSNELDYELEIKASLVKLKRELQSMYSKLSEEDKLLATLEGAVPDGLE